MASFNSDYMLWWPQIPKTAQRGPLVHHTVQRGHSDIQCRGHTLRGTIVCATPC